MVNCIYFILYVLIHGELTRNGEQLNMHVYGITISLLRLCWQSEKHVVLDTHIENKMTCGLS